jgi:positive regulator of sigma E activity
MSNDSCSIQHGIVESITSRELIVNIQATSACASCNAKGACGASDISDKAIHVPLSTVVFSVGERVKVIVKNSLGMLAVFLGYILPLILLLVVLFGTIPFYGEGIAGLASIGTVALYYLGLSFFKDRLSKKFTFEVTKLI